MANPHIPAEHARAVMKDIADRPKTHQLAVANAVSRYRRLGRFIKDNAAHLGTRHGVGGAYAMGVVIRVFETAGGKLLPMDEADILAAERRVSEVAVGLFPADTGFGDRLRAVPWRAQPGVLDVLIEDMFLPAPEGEEPRDLLALAQVFLLVWVAVEALDACWIPPDQVA